MRKKLFLILTSLLLLISILFIIYFFFNNNHYNMKLNKDIKIKENVKKEKKEDDMNDTSENNQTIIEDDNSYNYSNDISTSKSSKNNMESNNASNSNVINNNSNNESNNNPASSNTNNNPVNNYIPQTPTPEPVRELTEWEKLGISEYDYYNTPSDNEGELAFKGSTSLCQNEINRLVNKYYDSGIDGGNYYTINGKYTHAYLGCGIKMYMNGNAYTYSQIKSMGFN